MRTFAEVTATPWRSRGGTSSLASGTRLRPRRPAATDHCRVSGVVGQTTATRSTTFAFRRRLAISIDGRVLPAPGAAEIRNGPESHVLIASSAETCHARNPCRAVVFGALTRRPRLRDAPDGRRSPCSGRHSLLDERVGLDLDQHARVDEAAHLVHRAHRTDVGEGLAVGPPDL